MRYLLAALILAVASPVASFGADKDAAPASTNAEPIAVVLGKNIGPERKATALPLILGSILEKYAKDNNITVEEPEIDNFLLAMRRRNAGAILKLEDKRKDLEREAASPILSDTAKAKKANELAQCERLLKNAREVLGKMDGSSGDSVRARQMGADAIMKWKANRALFKKYGGRVIATGLEPESFDGKKAFFKEQAEAGAFRIFDKKLESYFWNVLTNDTLYAKFFVPEKDSESVMNNPWWMAGDRATNNIPAVPAGEKSGVNKPESKK